MQTFFTYEPVDETPQPPEPPVVIVPGYGPQGEMGPQGPQGFQGSFGRDGLPGPAGATGGPGPQGYQGSLGDKGYQGEKGTRGFQGFQGASIQGAKGDAGDPGTPGTAGPQGYQGASGTQAGGVIYTNTVPTPIAVGGVGVGYQFNSDSVQQVFDMLFYPYQAPAFTGFQIAGQATTQEVGSSLSGNLHFTWGTTNSGNVAADSITVRDVTNASNWGTGLPNSGSFDYALPFPYTPTSVATRTWSATGANTHSGTFTTSFTIRWYWRVYYGTNPSGTLTEADIKAFSSAIMSSGSGTYAFAGGDYKYICFPEAYPAATAFRDTMTQLNVAMASPGDDPFYGNLSGGYYFGLVPVTNSMFQTTNYRVYRTKNKLSSTITIQVS